jgi:hypothetical protein
MVENQILQISFDHTMEHLGTRRMVAQRCLLSDQCFSGQDMVPQELQENIGNYVLGTLIGQSKHKAHDQIWAFHLELIKSIYRMCFQWQQQL